MASVIIMKDMNQLRMTIQRATTEAPTTAMSNVVNTDGKQLYNAINKDTNVDTGRLKRGNIMEITPFGFHYWNNTPYAGIVNKRYNPHYMDKNLPKFKSNAVRRVNEELGRAITLIFKSFG